MSFSFTIDAPVPPDVHECLRLVKRRRQRLVWRQSLTGPWPDGTASFYVYRRSTRPIVVTRLGGRMTVRILVGASPSDHELAAHLACALATVAGQEVEPEYEGPLAAPTLLRKYGRKWATGAAKHGTEQLIWTAENVGIGRVGGPLGVFTIGPRLLAELRKERNRLELWQRLQKRMLLAHSLDTKNDMRERAETVTLQDGSPITVTYWWPDVRCVVPKADYVSLVSPDGGPIIFAWERLPAVAKKRLLWLDEDHVVVGRFRWYSIKGILDRAIAAQVRLPLKEPMRKFQ